MMILWDLTMPCASLWEKLDNTVCHTTEIWQIVSPIEGSDLPKVIEKLIDQKWVVCPGVKTYSSFKASIRYDMKRVTTCS